MLVYDPTLDEIVGEELVAFVEEVEGEEVEGDEETVNPVLPTGFDMVYAFIFFVALWAAMKYVLLPPINKVRAEREGKIAAARRCRRQRIGRHGQRPGRLRRGHGRCSQRGQRHPRCRPRRGRGTPRRARRRSRSRRRADPGRSGRRSRGRTDRRDDLAHRRHGERRGRGSADASSDDPSMPAPPDQRSSVHSKETSDEHPLDTRGRRARTDGSSRRTPRSCTSAVRRS